jgi:hypothetical protein
VVTTNSALLTHILHLLKAPHALQESKPNNNMVLNSTQCSKKKPFAEISNKPPTVTKGSPRKPRGKENHIGIPATASVPPMPRTRSEGRSPAAHWLELTRAPGSWAQVTHVESVASFDSPGRVSIEVDKDISFNIDSPRKKSIEGEQFLEEGSSTDKDSEVTKEQADEERLRAMIATRRLMVAANKGRYVCPEPSCTFCCEAGEILKIHVRNKHVELWGSPLRRQKMAVRLDRRDMDRDDLQRAMMDLNKSAERPEYVDEAKEGNLDNLNISKGFTGNIKSEPELERKPKGKKRKADDVFHEDKVEIIKTDDKRKVDKVVGCNDLVRLVSMMGSQTS